MVKVQARMFKAVIPFLVTGMTAVVTVNVLKYVHRDELATLNSYNKAATETLVSGYNEVVRNYNDIVRYNSPSTITISEMESQEDNFEASLTINHADRIVFGSAIDNLYKLSYPDYVLEPMYVNKYLTDAVNVNIMRLMQVYKADYQAEPWDTKKKLNTINLVWEFLVNQNNVDPTIAAAVLGSIVYEGEVGMQQGTYHVFTGIQDARNKLTAPTTDIGYGLVQWTSKGRRQWLLQFYEKVNEDLNYDWETISVVAECCALLEEIKKYNLYEDLTMEYDIEDATGIFACEFEIYDGYKTDWSESNGHYTLRSGADSGLKRYKYALSIYDHFMNPAVG